MEVSALKADFDSLHKEMKEKYDSEIDALKEVMERSNADTKVS